MGGGYNQHDQIYNTYRGGGGGGGTITTTKYTIHTVPFWTYYEIFWPIFYSDFEDFGKIMTFFGRYSSVIWIDFEDFWQITTFLVYILGDFEDILPPPSGWQSPWPNLHYIWCPFWTNSDIFWPISLCDFDDFGQIMSSPLRALPLRSYLHFLSCTFWTNYDIF